LQVPHLDINAEIENRSAVTLNEFDWQIANQRITSAQKWLQDYADEEEKLVIYLDKIPDRVAELTPEQIAYLEQLIVNLKTNLDSGTWDGDTLQTTLFSTSKEVELPVKDAFKAVYLSFLGKERGPKAGFLLSYLDREFVIARLQDVTKSAISKT